MNGENAAMPADTPPAVRVQRSFSAAASHRGRRVKVLRHERAPIPFRSSRCAAGRARAWLHHDQLPLPALSGESAARCDSERHRQRKDLFEHFVCKLIPHFREWRIPFGDAFCLCFEQQQSLLNPSVCAFRILFGVADNKENTGQFKKETEREEHLSLCRTCVFMLIQLLNSLRTER